MFNNLVVVNIKGMKTDIVQHGVDLNKNNIEKIILFIPGNPGVASLYDHCAQEIYSKTKIPVVVVGYLGHSYDNKVDKLYSIHEQLEHKVEFIKFLIQKNPTISIHLVGHSIGSWICLELLNRNTDNLKQFFGLFPTISHLNLSKNGQNFLLKMGVKFGIRNVVSFIVHFSSFIPSSVRLLIAKASKIIENEDDSLIEVFATKSYFNYQMMNNVLFMAGTEFSEIRDANYGIIDKNKSKIQFYYGETDHWVPDGFNEKMKKKYPNIVTIDEFKTKHGFILYQKGIQRTVQFIKKHLK
eukprot:gene4916-8504_t